MVKKAAALIAILFILTTRILPQEAEARVFTDSTSYLVGDNINYFIELKYPESLTVQIPPVADSVRFIDLISVKPPVNNISEGMIRSVYQYVFAGYDSATAVIPSMPIVFSSADGKVIKELKTNELLIQIRTLEVNTKNDILDVKAPIKIPLDLVFWGSILLAIILLSLAGYYFYKRYRLSKMPLESRQEMILIPPHKVALKELDELDNKKLWQQGKVKDYHSEITGIIRKYFEKSFGFAALEMPSSEVMDSMRKLPQLNVIFDLTRSFFENADLVKFAKFQPLASVNEEMMKQAESIVRSTIPEEKAGVSDVQ
ncbi:MAG: hypothetical protein K9I71_00230 [Ignavibacteriales bacterium]|nr:hypothetical protein [Ignavibacteriales bacterium]MCF8314517.1 hypothetical protein [Ignavibacteriales bacterium]MCF8436446.1 hypothetical protein [Ignavibacteriales bacterium]